jgi:hypothetical protein
MIQLFLIIAFAIGFALGWKVHQYILFAGLSQLSTEKGSGVEYDSNTNHLTIDTNTLKDFYLNKEKS